MNINIFNPSDLSTFIRHTNTNIHTHTHKKNLFSIKRSKLTFRKTFLVIKFNDSEERISINIILVNGAILIIIIITKGTKTKNIYRDDEKFINENVEPFSH